MKRAESRLFFVGSSLRAEPWSRFVCGRFAILAVVVGLAASGRKASSVVCACFTPAPLLSARLRRQ